MHVLSTPPAFILSQDQTLMLKVDSRSGLLSLANYPKPSLLGFCSEFSQIQRSKPDLLFSEFSGFYILFNLQLSRFSFCCQTCLLQRLFIITGCLSFVNNFFNLFFVLKSQAINAKLYLRNIISSFCTTMFAFCWQICTDCPSFRFALCLFYSFYASLASSFWNSSPEVFHPNISLG